MEEIESLLTPLWGSEQWILEGWNKINNEEKETIKKRLDHLFKDGLPFKLKHDKLLYVYTFSMMAQLEILGIQLPLLLEDKLQNPEYKARMRAQLVDEIFHTMVFTKIIFILSAPYASPPVFNHQIAELCEFIQGQDCIKMSMVMLNVVCEGLVEELFSVLYQYDIAPEVFKIVLADEHRHVCEADLYTEIGLPQQKAMIQTLHALEERVITTFSLQPQYSVALRALLGPRGVHSFLVALHEKHLTQLRKINMVPSERWDVFIRLANEHYSEFELHSEEVHTAIEQEIQEVEMTPLRKVMMTQFNNPGDPTMVAQFNIDITNYGFFEKKYPEDTLTLLMMQAVSQVLASHDSFRNFLSYKKLYRARGAYVSLGEKLPDCGDHMGTIHFKDCHLLTTNQLSTRIKRNLQMMKYCFKKREQVEQQHPELKSRLDDLLFSAAHEVHPHPVPGNYGVYLGNIGPFGYTQAVSPLLKNTGLHVLLLAVERKPVWNDLTKSFEPKDILPISISADNRIYDGVIPIPDLLREAFQNALNNMLEQSEEVLKRKSAEMKKYEEKIDELKQNYLTKKNMFQDAKLLSQLMNKKKLTKEVSDLFGKDLEAHGEKLSQPSNFKNIANNLFLDYLGFNADEAAKNVRFNKIVDKMLHENLEIGYRILASLQTAWVDYVDLEEAFNSAYEQVAHSRLARLAKFITTIR